VLLLCATFLATDAAQTEQIQHQRLRSLVQIGATQRVRDVLDSGANPNWRDNSDSIYQPIISDALRHPEVVKLLIEFGADVNGRREVRQNPADMRNLGQADGFTPLMLLASGRYGDAHELASLLLDGGADPLLRASPRGPAGLTAHDMARMTSIESSVEFPELLQVLREAEAKARQSLVDIDEDHPSLGPESPNGRRLLAERTLLMTDEGESVAVSMLPGELRRILKEEYEEY